MSVKARKFLKGIRLKSTTEAPTLDGEISNKDNKLQAHLEGDVRVVVTEDQTQTLTNKTIDATAATGTNSLSADSVDIVYDNTKVTTNPVGGTTLKPLGNDVQSALDAVKVALDNQNEASEIAYSGTNSGLTATNVQTAIDAVDGILDNHLADTTAHGLDKNISGNVIVGTKQNQSLENKTIDADNNTISNIETDNLKSGVLVTDITAASAHTELPSALAVKKAIEAQDEASEIEFNKTDDIPSENVQGAIEDVQANLKAHDDSSSGVHGLTPSIGNVVVGTTEEQDLENKTYIDAYFSGMISEGIANSIQTGSNVILDQPTQPIVRLSSGLTSIAGIAQVSYDKNKVLTIINPSFSLEIEIRNDSDIVDTKQRIVTGVDDDITLAPQAALFLKYDSVSQVWRVIGGTGGSSTVVKGIAGEAVSGGVFSVLGSDGKIYRLNAADDDRIEYIGITKDFALEGEPVKVITSGIAKGFIGLTPGLPVYASPSSTGEYTQTDPENSIFDNKWVIRLGIAISATQILLNPDQASSAYFKDELSASTQTIANNQSSEANISNLIFDGSQVRGAIVQYTLYRRTDDIEYAQIGQFNIVYKTDDMTWILGAESYAGDNAGVTFSITNAGQIQYVSSNMAGANYSGSFQYKIDKLFEI
jgi:hypothetical protein